MKEVNGVEKTKKNKTKQNNIFSRVWSVMAEQNVQAKDIYWFLVLLVPG